MWEAMFKSIVVLQIRLAYYRVQTYSIYVNVMACIYKLNGGGGEGMLGAGCESSRGSIETEATLHIGNA